MRAQCEPYVSVPRAELPRDRAVALDRQLELREIPRVHRLQRMVRAAARDANHDAVMTHEIPAVARLGPLDLVVEPQQPLERRMLELREARVRKVLDVRGEEVAEGLVVDAVDVSLHGLFAATRA